MLHACTGPAMSAGHVLVCNMRGQSAELCGKPDGADGFCLQNIG
jgi:hypothetical protein